MPLVTLDHDAREVMEDEVPEMTRVPDVRISTPVNGDILASGRSARADVFDISIVAADGRAVVSRYSDAIDVVRELSRALRVNGWFTSDQTHYARIAVYRSER